jgi:hypothetical protein
MGGTNMYQLLSRLSASELFIRQLPVFGSAFVITELFYKFHSFTLECAAFLKRLLFSFTPSQLPWSFLSLACVAASQVPLTSRSKSH